MLAWKPMVTLTRSAISMSFRGLHDLGEHAAGRLGVHEGHPAVADARAGLLVDEAQARRAQAVELGLDVRSEEHTSELQSHVNLVCRLLLEKKKYDKRCRCIRASS